MTETLVNGQRLNLAKYLNEFKQLRIEVNYELNEGYSLYGSEIRIGAFGLDEDKKVPDNLYFIDQENFRSPCSGITFSRSNNEDNKTIFLIDFSKLSSRVNRIIFVFSLENSATEASDINYQLFKNFTITLSDLAKNELMLFSVPLEFSLERTFEIFEIYNRNFEWKAVANYYSYLEGLEDLGEKYGCKRDKENLPQKNKVQPKPVIALSEPLAKKIRSYRQKLLDLSRRNPLINLKNVLELDSDNFSGLFILFGENNKTLTILPQPEDENFSITETEVFANKTKKELSNLLYRTKMRAVSSIEEQGVNTLYIAFGLLNWSESEKEEEKFLSPLVLLPAELEKAGLNSPYRLKMIDDEIIGNPALRFKISSQFGIELPEVPEDLNIITLNDYLGIVQEKVKNIPNALVEKRIAVGIFSFNKLVLYKDLENYQHLIQEHPLLNPESAKNPTFSDIESCRADVLDHTVKSRETFQVLDADSSQQEAVALAEKGVSFILQGPPGTGKSQTITNIIAECLAEGKSVLFVSEKMAALEVVKKRLENCGLGHFCLEIHSNKTAKKEILQSLERSLHLQNKELKGEIEKELDKLDQLKKRLNEYVRILHKPAGEMEVSAHQAQAVVAALTATELIVFVQPDIFALKIELMNKIQEKLKILAGLTSVLPDPEKNPWKNVLFDYLSVEKENLIKRNLEENVQFSGELLALFRDYWLKTGWKKPEEPKEIDSWQEVVSFLLTSEQPLKLWLDESFDREKLLKETLETKSAFERYLLDKKNFFSIYKPELLEAEKLKRLQEKALNLKNEFESLDTNYLENYDLINKLFTDFQNFIRDIWQQAEIINDLTGVSLPKNFVELEYLQRLFSLLESDPLILREWLTDEALPGLSRNVQEAKQRTEEYYSRLKNFLQKYPKEILDLNISELLQRFENNYNGVFRMFNAVYKADLKQIADILNQPKLTYSEALDLLKKAEIAHKDKQNFENERKNYLRLFADFYQDEKTNWVDLARSVKTIQEIVAWFADRKIPEKLKNLLSEKGLKMANLNVAINDLRKADKNLREVLNQLKSFRIIRDNPDKNDFFELRDHFMAKQNNFVLLGEFAEELYQYTESKDFDWNYLLKDLNNGRKMIEFAEQLNEEELHNKYQHFFNGLSTGWEKLVGVINWAINFRSKYKDDDLLRFFGSSENLLVALASKNDLYFQLETFYQQSRNLFSNYQRALNEYQMLFNNQEMKVSGKEIGNLSFGQSNKWFVQLVETIYSLNEWLNFKEVRKFFQENGFPDFIDKIIEKRVAGGEVINVFNKRFYQVFLDQIFAGEPVLRNFNGDNHNKLIDDFRQLDLDSLNYAKARLQVRLRQKVPKNTFFEMQSSEIGILNTELAKKRKHKPLRRLFGEIKNTIFRLKPCFMMSPLSVSQFIDPERLKFDVVIFDEASQIFPEDGLSAILRAEQAIIVGDKKQMPPANFFRFIDQDESEEYDEAEIPEYESILDEYTDLGFPSCMLEWHYRSKDESLIAFSNKHFYENRLYTFPTKNFAKSSLEFVKAEGVYDRGGSRQNRKEAEKVAELVFEHFRRYGNKLSLGVITFNEPQQMAVLTEIERKRLEDGSIEEFFEAKDNERFFVKNIENVQGDERDLIIFSVGYAKDQNNKLSYNFGVLNQNGGERRLNVAVTRARSGVKIVSSMRYTDMDPTHLRSKGSQLLRNYLEYAERGNVALFAEQTVSSALAFDSPFEEYVYQALTNRGYTVRSQVGSSGYRIDLAIVDPANPGRFLLGIECDGATYHSAKTARDRDRLRQQILEGLGWKIHRIWSRDWVSDPEKELRKIEAVLQDAGSKQTENESEIVIEDLLKETVKVAENAENGLKKYQLTELENIGEPEEFIQVENTFRISQTIYRIVKAESPVLMSSVTKRVMAAWKINKATPKIQKRFKEIFANSEDHFRLDKNEFLWDSGMTEVEVRVPGDFRAIEEIAPEEYEKTLIWLLQNAHAAERDELFKTTAKLFEFTKVTPNLREKLEKIIEAKIATGIFFEQDSLLRIKDNQQKL